MVRASDFGPRGSLVRTPAGAHFVVALSKSHLPCFVLVEPNNQLNVCTTSITEGEVAGVKLV